MAWTPEVSQVKNRILWMNENQREESLRKLSQEVTSGLKQKQVADLIQYNKSLLNSLKLRESISIAKDGKQIVTANTLDDLQEKLAASKTENTRDFKKAARDVVKAGKNIEKMDQAVINQKLDFLAKTVDADIDIYILNICMLAQKAGINIDLLFMEEFDPVAYKLKVEESARLTQDTSVQKATNDIVQVAKSGADQDTVLWVINQKVDEFAKKTLIDKWWWSQWAVDFGKFVWWLCIAVKALWFANDQFPGGIEWLIMKIWVGYAAYAWYDKYKDEILKSIKSVTGVDAEKNQNKPKDELAHRNLESKAFKDGEIFFKWILARFKNPQSEKLNAYVSLWGFDLERFISDYSGESVVIWTSVTTIPVASSIVLPESTATPVNTQNEKLSSEMRFPNAKEYDHIAMLHGQIIAGNGQYYKDSINTYIKWLNLLVLPKTIQWYNEAFGIYENTQKVRYQILKKVGYELVIDKDESQYPKDIRKDVDKILSGVNPNRSTDTSFELKDPALKELLDAWYIIKFKETPTEVLEDIKLWKQQWLVWLDTPNEQREFVKWFTDASLNITKLATPEWLPNYPMIDYDTSWMSEKNSTWNTGNKVLYYENYWIRVPFIASALNSIAIQWTDVHGNKDNIFYQMDTWAFAIATLHYSSNDQWEAEAWSKEIFTYGEWWLRYVWWGNNIKESVMNMIGQWALGKRFALAATNGADGKNFSNKLTALKDREDRKTEYDMQWWKVLKPRSMWSQGWNLPPHYLARHRNGQRISINESTINQAVQTWTPEYTNESWGEQAAKYIKKQGWELGKVTTAFTQTTLQIVWDALKSGYKEVWNNLIWPDGFITLVWDVLIETWYEWVSILNKVTSKGVHDISHNNFLRKDLKLTTNRVTGLTIDTLEWILKWSWWLINKVLWSKDFEKLLNAWWATAEKLADIVLSTATHIFWDSKEEMWVMGWLRTWWAMAIWWWMKNWMSVPSAK